jgi:hypothetical protein
LERGKVRKMELLTRSAQLYSGHLRPEVPLVGAGTSGLSGTTQAGHERLNWRKRCRPEVPVETTGTSGGTGNCAQKQDFDTNKVHLEKVKDMS